MTNKVSWARKCMYLGVILILSTFFLSTAAIGDEIAKTRLGATLKAKAASTSEGTVDVCVISGSETDVTGYMEKYLVRPEIIDGIKVTIGKVPTKDISKIATTDGVEYMFELNIDAEAPAPADPDILPPKLTAADREERLAKLKAAAANPVTRKAVDKGTRGWYDVGFDGHNARMAWNKGFTGKQVRVAVMDDSVDFGHPDLAGTQARIGDAASPYAGWPYAYDPFSLYLYAMDTVTGTDYIENGAGWYADTSTVLDSGAGGLVHPYRPIGASSTHSYTLPDSSKSGLYHIGSHPDENLDELWYNERVAVLVVDEAISGVYDTVYVDLNNNYNFTDDMPVRKEQPISTWDVNSDGIADLSGGMIYWITDGVNTLPAADWLWGISDIPGAGDMVLFMGAMDYDSDHGTLCASNVVGRGMINGGAPDYKPLSGDRNGMIQGMAPDAELVAMADIYMNHELSSMDAWYVAAFGIDGAANSGDEIQVISNSFGSSDTHNDGWDNRSRYADYLVRSINPTSSHLVSTGNGAPGYGTTAPPSPSASIGVGSSTAYGSAIPDVGDSIFDYDQITFGQVAPFSNRGPGARGNGGVDILASGSLSTGAQPLNMSSGFDGQHSGDGWYAWQAWSGTSRSCPVAAGTMALIYEAYRTTNGEWPNWKVAKGLMMHGAVNANNDALTQGSGVIDADISTDLAGDRYGLILKGVENLLNPGDYRGFEIPAFTKLMEPDSSFQKDITIKNVGTLDVFTTMGAYILSKADSGNFSFTSNHINQESPYNFGAPNYLIDITNYVSQPNTDMVAVNVNFPYNYFDLNGDNYPENEIRVVIYQWKDQNGDGNLWTDNNGNGTVNFGLTANGKVDFGNSEIDEGEFNRLVYSNNGANSHRLTLKVPDTGFDGIFLGIQHSTRSSSIPTTPFSIELDTYRMEEWSWANWDAEGFYVLAGTEVPNSVEFNVPDDTMPGIYSGFLSCSYSENGPYSGNEILVPVCINVPGSGSIFEFGGPESESDEMYDNGTVSGFQDTHWRQESGDTRFFFTDIETADDGDFWVVHTEWDGSLPEDIDTRIMEPVIDIFSDPDHPMYDPYVYGPYTLDILSQSTYNALGAGRWAFDTKTDDTEEWVATAMTPGLHGILLHNILDDGTDFETEFTGETGIFNVSPDSVSIVSQWPDGEFSIDVSLDGIDFGSLCGSLRGSGQESIYHNQYVYQDDSNNPTTASYSRAFNFSDLYRLRVETQNATGPDYDLFIFRDGANGYPVDGTIFYPGEVVGSALTTSANETVTIEDPADGYYLVLVHGYSVSPSPGTFDLSIVQFNDSSPNFATSDLPVSPFDDGDSETLDILYGGFSSQGSYEAELAMGPCSSDPIVSIPISVYYQPLTGVTVARGPNDKPNITIGNHDQNVPMLQLAVTATAKEAVRISGLRVWATGSGDDFTDVSSVKLIHDINGNGEYDIGTDVYFGSSSYNADSGTTYISGSTIYIDANATEYLLVVEDLNGSASINETFRANFINNAEIYGYGTSTGQSITARGASISGNRRTVENNPPVFAGLQRVLPLDGGAYLEWLPATDQSEPIIYNVYQVSPSRNTAESHIATTYATNITINGLSNGGYYSYIVRAEDATETEETNNVVVEVIPSASLAGTINPSFEQSMPTRTIISGKPELWNASMQVSGAKTTMFSSTTESYAGSWAAMISTTGQGPSGDLTTSSLISDVPVSLEAGKTYQISAAFKRDEGNWVRIVIFRAGYAVWTIGDFDALDQGEGSPYWERKFLYYTVPMGTGATGDYFIRIDSMVSNDRTLGGVIDVLVDDIQIQETDDASINDIYTSGSNGLGIRNRFLDMGNEYESVNIGGETYTSNNMPLGWNIAMARDTGSADIRPQFPVWGPCYQPFDGIMLKTQSTGNNLAYPSIATDLRIANSLNRHALSFDYISTDSQRPLFRAFVINSDFNDVVSMGVNSAVTKAGKEPWGLVVNYLPPIGESDLKVRFDCVTLDANNHVFGDETNINLDNVIMSEAIPNIVD